LITLERSVWNRYSKGVGGLFEIPEFPEYKLVQSNREMAYLYRPHGEVEVETTEVELSRLKRQYRIMEKDRMICVEDARLQLRHQQGAIDHLERERIDLVLAMNAAKSKTLENKDQEMEKKLKYLLVQHNEYIGMIGNEKQQITELDDQINKVSPIAIA